VTPRQAVTGAKAGHRHGLRSIEDERADQPVAGGAQHTIDVLNKLSLALVRGS
jgi:hypothetical protein